MRNILKQARLLSDDYDLCLTSSINPKKAGLTAIRPEVLNQDDICTQSGGHPNIQLDSAAWPENEKRWLRGLYKETYKKGRLAALRSGAYAAARNRCVLCNVGRVRTLDHHLPIAHHPALSISSINLVPVCRDCNYDKGDACDLNPNRHFFHPYCDLLPAGTRFLKVDLFNTGVLSPRYAIDQTCNLTNQLLRRISYTFSELGLGELYLEEAIDFFGGRRDHWLDTLQNSGMVGLNYSLDREAMGGENNWGLNHWMPVFIRALRASQHFQANAIAVLQR